MASHLPGIQQAVASLAGAQDEALTEARASVAKALHNCFHEVSSRDVSPDERKQIDLALSADATALKGALFKALKVCDLHRAFLGLPATLEATRLQLAAAPAKGVATYLEVDLCADIDACSSRQTLDYVRQVLDVLLGGGRLKKDLGTDLPQPHRKSCRTAANRAQRAQSALEAVERVAKNSEKSSAPRVYEMETDVRIEDAEDSARRRAAHEAGIDALFANAKRA